MPEIANKLAATQAPRVLGNQLTIGNDSYLSGRYSHRDEAVCPFGRHTVTVMIHSDKAGTRDPQGFLHIAIKIGSHRIQQRLLLCKAFGNGAGSLLRMSSSCQLQTTRRQPSIECSKILKLGCRRNNHSRILPT